MNRLITTLALLGAFAVPALAQTTEWYVVQDTTTKRCTIVNQRPTVTTQVIVTPSGTVYKTREEAEAGMKTIKVCSTQ